jgi:hypothetical protein
LESDEVKAMIYPEGTLVRGGGPEIYQIEAGRRRRIPDPATFIGHGCRWEQVRQIADQDLKALPLGEPLPSIGLPYVEKQDSLGNEHYMATTAALLPSNGRVIAATQTWTRNFWIGFTGGVLVLLLDEYGNVAGHTGIQSFAVDGLAAVASPSARTDYWHAALPPALIARACRLALVHKTAPESRRDEIFAQVERVACEAAASARAAAATILELAAIVA